MKKILFIALIVMSNFVLAAWQVDTTVKEVVIEGGNDGSRTYVVFEDKFNPTSCSNNSGFIRIYANTQKGEYLISAMLTAYVSKSVVMPNIGGCDDWGRPILTGVRVK